MICTGISFDWVPAFAGTTVGVTGTSTEQMVGAPHRGTVRRIHYKAGFAIISQ